VRSNKVARKCLTESNGTPAMDLGPMNEGRSKPEVSQNLDLRLSKGRLPNNVTSHFVTFQVRCDAARFRIFFLSTSKNMMIFLELGTNVTISSHCHIIFMGSAYKKHGFQNLARSWVLGSRFSNFGLERPWTSFGRGKPSLGRFHLRIPGN